MKNQRIEKLVRKEVFSFQPYIPGKPVAEVARERNIQLNKIIKLASNENPLGPSKKAITSLRKNLGKIYFYPESNCPELRKKLARKLKVKPENLIFGNGSDEIIELIGKTFLNPEDEIIVSEHAFIRYKMAGDLMGCKIVTVPMTPPLSVIANEVKQSRFSKGAGFTHNLEAMVKAVTRRTKVIFIANPNNPTGTYNTAKEFEDFLLQIADCRLQILIVVDEAYYEYAKVEKDYPDTLEYLREGKNIIILRTFSKIYALAGLRIGYGIAKKEIIDFLERIRPPFNVNYLAQVSALASLNDDTQIERSAKLVKNEKKYLYTELTKLGIEYIPSSANFILLKMNSSGQRVFDDLLAQGIIVRAMEEYGFPEYIRVTIGLPQENKKFITVLRNYLKERSY